MKKLLIGLLIFLILFLGCVYIVIPAGITVSLITSINASINSTQRYLSDKAVRIKWWPGNDTANEINPGNNISFYRGYNFMIPHYLSNSTIILITRNNKDINSSVILFDLQLIQHLFNGNVNLKQALIQLKKYNSM